MAGETAVGSMIESESSAVGHHLNVKDNAIIIERQVSIGSSVG
jgi:hypothetical protein